MLILDKQLALEHVVARTVESVANSEMYVPPGSGGAPYGRVARYEVHTPASSGRRALRTRRVRAVVERLKREIPQSAREQFDQRLVY